ncbi:hypothetical protein EVJ58_g2713 [Rhodofomes roseus]|uniref:Magnesium transporter n=1 Tax=Rhodofomes roseus TaxID=34475 RepID=A0A4Y9YRE6_9APHY|nr:hypothetical protein EVJ58_g2713 [Rhodofomes roseus]
MLAKHCGVSLEPSDGLEEAAKVAILEKAMKGRQPTDLMLRCTILDADGNVKTISGQFRRADLCSEHRLNPRDLRKIDSRIPNLVPTILVRKEVILVNILHIRALVKADTVVLFDTYGSADSRLHSVFLYHLEHNLKTKSPGLPYEFRALDSILLSVLSALEAEMVFIRNLIGGLLAELEDDIDHDRFKRLLHYSRRLASFQNRAKLLKSTLEENEYAFGILSIASLLIACLFSWNGLRRLAKIRKVGLGSKNRKVSEQFLLREYLRSKGGEGW